MGKLIADITIDAFSKRSSLSYELNMLIGEESCIFCINDAQLNLLVLRNYQIDYKTGIKEGIKEIFFNDKLLNLPYRQIKVAFINEKSTLVPLDLFEADFESTYFRNLYPLQESEQILQDKIVALHLMNLYIVDNQLFNSVHNFFNNAHFHHSTTPFIVACKKIAELQNNAQVFVNLQDKLMQICYFNGNNLIFCNTFKFLSSRDFLYYLMNVYNQFKLNPETVPIIISGAITDDSEIFGLIHRYIRHLNFAPAPGFFRFSEEFNLLAKYQYFDLFHLKLCE